MNKIKIKHGDNEIEVEGTDEFIKTQLDKFYQKVKNISPPLPPTEIKKELIKEHPKTTTDKTPSPAEFYKQKGKTDGISQLLIFAKYLELYAGKTEFSKRELNDIAKEAKLAKDIHSQYFTNAVKQGLLRQSNSGKYSLTLSAEEVLASM